MVRKVQLSTWVAACFVTLAFTQHRVTGLDPLGTWAIAEYPNPQQQPRECGRETRDSSYVCDPDRIISFDEANQIDVLIHIVMNETTCVCSTNMCDNSVKKGYRIAVAMMNKMADLPDIDPNDMSQTVNLNLHKAEVFAMTKLQQWQIGRCREDVIILYSELDNVLYTMTGSVAARTLTGTLIGEISMKHRIYFTPSANVFQGLRGLILDYKDVFNGRYERMTMATVTPRYGAVLGSRAAVVCPSVTFTFTLFFSAIIIFTLKSARLV